jgi:hypothetical protein
VARVEKRNDQRARGRKLVERMKMSMRYFHTVTVCLAAAMLAACGGSHPPIGAPGTVQAHRMTSSSNRYVFVTNDTSNYGGGSAEVDYWLIGSSGDVAPTAVISGSNTRLAMPLEGIVVDSTGEIYAADQWAALF